MPNQPYVILKAAVSVDGFIDDSTSQRLILSNQADRDRVDQVRAECDAIMIGANTIRVDNPRLIVNDDQRRAQRVATGRPEHPVKITVTKTGDLDTTLKWFHHGGQRLVYTTDTTAPELGARLQGLADVIALGPTVSFHALLDDLHHRDIDRLLVEGGEQIHTALLSENLADEIQLAVAPLLVGNGPRFLAPTTYPWLTTRRMCLVDARTIGNDVVLLRYHPKHESK